MSVLVFSGLLSVPSAVFAEANWYGSLRGGVEFGGGETNFYDGGSRWGIKGSAEAGEGLTAVYRFEHKFETTDAGLPGGRLAYVGLSGGFGSLALGQVWSASYNHAGVIRDFPNWYTASDTSARVGNALSYALSTDVFSMQIDAIMDGEKDTGKAIDQLEFGMTISLGEIGKVAFSHMNAKDTLKMVPLSYWAGTDNETEVQQIMVTVANGNISSHIEDGMLNDAGVNALNQTDGMYDTGGVADCDANARDTDATNDCQVVTAYVSRMETSTSENATGDNTNVVSNTVSESYYAEAEELAAHSAVKDQGYKANHVSAEFGVGAVTAALGYSENKMNGASGKTKTTFIGAKGSIGDTGLNWGAFSRVKNNADGTKVKPWTIGVSKTLGGGAWTYVEHGNYGNDGSTVVALGINF